MASADALTEKLDALAAALREAGIPADRTATILGSAATATMNALLLDAVLEENAEVAAPLEPEQAPDQLEQPLRVAA